MKKIIIALLMCSLSFSVMAQLPFVSFEPVHAEPVQRPSSSNSRWEPSSDPLGLGNAGTVNYRNTQTSSYRKMWWTAIAVSVKGGGTTTEFEECNIRILQDEHLVKIFTTNETLTFVNAEEEILQPGNNGIIFQTRKCVDKDGDRCILNFMYDTSNNIFFFIEYREISVCYVVIPD